MYKMSHAPSTAPSAWRGPQKAASSRPSLPDSIAKEFQMHPVATLGYLAAAVALAKLALTPSKKKQLDWKGEELAARRRSRH